MRKRILSILLCLVMVVGLFPTMAFAADGSGATKGSGTKSNPYCVSTYAEMKRLLQTPASYYIKVVGMDNNSTNGDTPVRILYGETDYKPMEAAISIPRDAHHHLEIATNIWFVADPTEKENGSIKNLFGRLIDVETGSSLEVTGTGSLRVEVNALTARNVIICNWGGELTIDGNVTLNGIQDFHSNVATRPIFIKGGVTNIKGGYIYGHNNMTISNDGGSSAISVGETDETLAEGTVLNISGGTIKQVNNETNQGNEDSCALYVRDDEAADAIHLTGGIFEGGMKMANGKPLSDLLAAGYQFYDMDANTVFDGSVSKTQKKLMVTPIGVDNPTVIDKASLAVKPLNERKTLSDLACSYSPNDKMVLDNFTVFKGLNNQWDKIEDHNTQYDANQGYTVMYVFTAKEGLSYSPDIKNHVSVSGGNFWKADNFFGRTDILRVFVNLPAASTAGQVVKTVTIQVTPKAERTKLNDFRCQSYTPTDSMGSPAYFVREGLNTNGSGKEPAAYDENKNYSVVYEFPINSGCTIAEDISKADVTINDGKVWQVKSDSDGKNLLVYVNFPAKAAEDPNYVTEAAVQIAAPVAGEKPKGTVDIPVLGDNKDKVKKAMMWWSGMLSGNTAFVAGQEYTAIVYLEPKEGVTFADDMKLNVNGKVVDLLSKDYDGSVQFKVMFTAVAPSAPTTPAITTVTLPDGKVGDAYSQTLAATGSNPITWGIEAGTLPDGLTLAGDTIKGTPSKAGEFKFTVKATNGGGSDTKELTIKVADAEASKYHNVTLSDAGTGATGAGSHAEGTTVNIYAGTKSGYTFNGWTSDDVTVLSASSKNASFVMPDKDVTVKANWVYNGGGSTGGGYTYYTIKATAGVNGSISPTGNVSVREGRDQTFTITPDKGYAVAKVLIDSKNVGAVKSYTFENVKKNHTIEVVFMKASGNPQTGVFVDVPEGSYYEEAVNWAVEKGITTGTDATHFSPDGICTRAQAVTFLWRAAGSPAAKSAVMPFTDVKAGSYYYDAVLWAVENGITKGTSETMFSPDATCSRAQIVTFLWRSQKSPAAGTANPFTDVKASAYYADAVLWAVKEDVTKGTTNTTFSPDANCTRAQIVTFIWRALAE